MNNEEHNALVDRTLKFIKHCKKKNTIGELSRAVDRKMPTLKKDLAEREKYSLNAEAWLTAKREALRYKTYNPHFDSSFIQGYTQDNLADLNVFFKDSYFESFDAPDGYAVSREERAALALNVLKQYNEKLSSKLKTSLYELIFLYPGKDVIVFSKIFNYKPSEIEINNLKSIEDEKFGDETELQFRQINPAKGKNNA